MKTTTLRRNLIALALGTLVGGAALSQTATTAIPASGTSSATTTASRSSTSTASDKLVSEFTPLAGSKENATSLVNGLRTGSAVTLTSPATGGGSATATSTNGSTTFTPPTKPMGYGNVRIALSLAQTQLANQGVTQPTSQQLQTSLMGSGTSTTGGTTSQGILQMRASGMGWGQIANSMGVKLGAVMSGHATAGTGAATKAENAYSDSSRTRSGEYSSAGASAGHGKSSVVTGASGTNHASHGKGSGITTAASGANPASHGKGSGVTTAAGGTASVTTGLGKGHAGAAASGIVSANGAASGAAHGQGGGLGGGQGRGKI